jgi:hypothetical protein
MSEEEQIIIEFPWRALKVLAGFVLAFGVMAFFVGLIYG